MRRPYGLLTLVLLMTASPALAQATRPVTKPAAPALPGMKVLRDVPYVPNGVARQTLDFYLPETPPAKPLPVVVWVHGGGWQEGDKADCPSAMLVYQGYAAVSVGYRLSQDAVFPAQIQDCQAAIRFLRANAKKYNLDPDHVGVMGGSAGGHLVALLGTAGGKNAFPKIGGNEDASDRVQAVLDVCGPTDFTTLFDHAAADKSVKYLFERGGPGDAFSKLIGSKVGDDKAKDQAVSPVHYVTKDAPPFLIYHGTVDPIVPFAQSAELADKLKAAGADAILQPFPGVGHGGDAFARMPVLLQMTAFFNKHLKGMDVKVEVLPDKVVAAKPGEDNGTE